MNYHDDILKFPEIPRKYELFEPIVKGTLVFPDQYLGKLLKLCEVRKSLVSS